MRFSERIGKRQPKVDIQVDWMDEDLKNGLWNVICMYIIKPIKDEKWLAYSPFKSLIESIWFSFFKEPLDTIPHDILSLNTELRSRFFNWDYLDVYDFIQFLVSENTPFDKNGFVDSLNFVLKRELSAYRFVDKLLAPVTSEMEINEIENAISSSYEKGFKGVNIHLKTALSKLSDKNNPDYRNSIKESISAVESMCQLITNDSKAELGKALKLLKNKLPIHGALEQGFIKIYGYTSDGEGIRHAMLDESNLDQEDALFMLISCSSFVNYLTTKVTKAGLELK
ncbi:MAG TPA: hypothetical protein VJ945_07765 [Flavobacteriaceae bacterium]|nr:hypothetical protein [Flavobacteriaceae bacterium]